MIMRIFVVICLALYVCSSCSFTPRARWVMTTKDSLWVEREELVSALVDTIDTIDVKVLTKEPQQRVEGFGACFNEAGWLALNNLDPQIRERVMEELFFPGLGANFTLCRMPIGANDFARDWYSYDEVDGDFSMDHFTIANDLQTLIPFIQNALKYQPDLRLWASPWCPPSWMKYNKHYASVPTNESLEKCYQNDLPMDQIGREGTDMFIQDSLYLRAYALYFSKFIEAYQKQNISIFAVMPQNEFNSPQIFPSCCWTAVSLANFIGKYLGPALRERKVDIMLGTVERANELLIDTIMADSLCRTYIKGIGLQWAGRKALPGIHKRYPQMPIYQTEQECGDGNNDWKSAFYAWNLMRYNFEHGVSAYMYWNIALECCERSRWGWAQNSLVVVDPKEKNYRFTPEYYIMKHASHYVLPDAYVLKTEGAFTNILAFRNEDDSIVLIIANETSESRTISVQVGDRVYKPCVKPYSISTLFID